MKERTVTDLVKIGMAYLNGKATAQLPVPKALLEEFFDSFEEVLKGSKINVQYVGDLSPIKTCLYSAAGGAIGGGIGFYLGVFPGAIVGAAIGCGVGMLLASMKIEVTDIYSDVVTFHFSPA